MKTKITKALCSAALGLALGGAWAVPGLALEYRTEAYIPAEVQTDAAARQADYVVEIIGAEGAPMPQEERLVFHGPDRLAFGPLEYTRPEIYGYLVREQAGTDPAIRSDDTEYGVLVTVENDGKGGLQASVVSFKWKQETGDVTLETLLQTAGAVEKSEIIFRNRAVPTPTPHPTPQPGDGDETPPESGEPMLTLAAAPLRLFPQTGDGSLPLFWAVMMAAGGIGFCLCGWQLVRRR